MNLDTGRKATRRWLVTIAALALTLVGTGCASIQPRADLAHIGYAAAAVADAQSTQSALAAGADEINPLLGNNPSTGKILALKAGGFVILRNLENSWERSLGRDLKWYEKVLLWGLPIGLQAWAASHNANNAVPRR